MALNLSGWVSAVAWAHLTGSGEKQALLGCNSNSRWNSSEEWGMESASPLSALTMKAVTTGSSETTHLPCDSDQLTADDFALERAACHGGERSYFQMASPT